MPKPKHPVTASVALTLFTLVLTSALPAVADAPASTRSAARYEVRFMTEMIDHHAMAVMMAEICLEKAVHEELRAMCQDIVTSQTEEIELMQSWLQDWYGVSHEPEMSPGAQKQMEQMASLSPEEFEIEFMKSMIRHHWKAVVRGAQCTERAYHPELIALCEEMVMAQTQEIQQMQEWLCSWYGVCNYGPKGRRT